MSDFNVSSRYANALLAVATESNLFDEISNDVNFVLANLQQVKELKVALQSPVLKLEKKLQILEAVFKEKVNAKTLEFLKFVLKKNRETLLIQILKRFCSLRDNKQGIAKIDLKVAFDISEELKLKLNKRLEDITKKKVFLDVKKDESIIGGFIAKHEDIVYDASVKHSLELLKDHFIKGNIGIN